MSANSYNEKLKRMRDISVPDNCKKYFEFEEMSLNATDNTFETLLSFVQSNFTPNEMGYVSMFFVFIPIIRPFKFDIAIRLFQKMVDMGYKPPISPIFVHHQDFALLQLANGNYTMNEVPREYRDPNTTVEKINVKMILNPYEPGTIPDVISRDDIDGLQNIASVMDIDYNRKLCCLGTFFDLEKLSMLCFAAVYGAIKCFNFIKEKNPSLDGPIANCAVVGGNLDIVKSLANSGLDKTLRKSLILALMLHNYEVSDWLLDNYECKIRPDGRIMSFGYLVFFFENNFPNKYFMYFNNAIKFGYVNYLPLIIDAGADVNQENHDAWVPLHFAAQRNQISALELLLEKGAEPNVANWNNDTPLTFALKNDSLEAYKLLVSKGALTKFGKGTAIQLPAKYGALKICKYLLENGEDVNFHEEGCSPLDLSIFSQNESLVEFFINHNAKVDEPDLIKTAFLTGSTKICELLLSKGTIVNNINQLLLKAVKKEKVGVAELLIKYGADVNYKEGDVGVGTYCSEEDFPEMYEMLIKNGAVIEKGEQRVFRKRLVTF